MEGNQKAKEKESMKRMDSRKEKTTENKKELKAKEEKRSC